MAQAGLRRGVVGKAAAGRFHLITSQEPTPRPTLPCMLSTCAFVASQALKCYGSANNSFCPECSPIILPPTDARASPSFNHQRDLGNRPSSPDVLRLSLTSYGCPLATDCSVTHCTTHAIDSDNHAAHSPNSSFDHPDSFQRAFEQQALKP